MKLDCSQVRMAAAEYAKGNYSAAIDIYKRLGQQLGKDCFAANIWLCEQRLGLRKTGLERPTFFLPEVTTSEHDGLSQEISPKNELDSGLISEANVLEISESDILWYKISVIPGHDLIIKAAVEYRNIGEGAERKALLILNGLNIQGNAIDQPCGKLSYSDNLRAFFKYLPCTKNQVQELHSFTVPKGVQKVRLGLCGFNRNKGEQVFVRALCVVPVHDEPIQPKFVTPSSHIAEMSILGWPDYPPSSKPYVIGIMDEFTAGCFEQDVNLIQPRPDNWYALAEKYPPAFFFIESAWKGNYGSWQYRVADYSNKPEQSIAHICQYAKKKGIPTLFWNKEDPVHHDKFMCSAKLVDYIFTSDANMKKSYHVKTGNPNVHALPFAAQPALHKPAPLASRKFRACFAGSWYGNRHADRKEVMQWLLRAANKFGLDIYDRNHGSGVFPFPDEYQANIKGSLPYKKLCQEYRRYRVFLNANSVIDSPTMFSRRVFELMACGTPLVSTYAKGIETFFESEAVWLVNSQAEADEALHILMTDDVEWRRRSLAGIREVFAKHLYAHRLNDIFKTLGLPTRIPTDPTIALVVDVNSQSEFEAVNRFAHGQSYQRFSIGVDCSRVNVNLTRLISDKLVFLQSGEKASWLANQNAFGSIFGCINPNSYYGVDYLRDLANASLYEPAAKGWGKSLNQDCFAYGELTALSGTLWRATEFKEQYLTHNIDYTFSSSDVYVADSDQYQLQVMRD